MIKVEIDVRSNKNELMEILDSMELAYNIENGGKLIKADLTQEQFDVLNRQLGMKNIKATVENGARLVSNAVAKTAHFAAVDVAAPTVKLAAKATAGAVRMGTTASVVAAAGIINAVASSGRAAKEEMKTNPDCVQAKEELKNAWNTLGGLFKRAIGSSSIRVVK